MSIRSITILTISWKLTIILQNIWRRVVGSVLSNISYSNIFLCFFLERFHQNSQAVLATLSIKVQPLMKGYELASPSLTDVTGELILGLLEIKHSMTRLPASHWLRSDTVPKKTAPIPAQPRK